MSVGVIEATTSGIQIATLIVAILAVLASLGGAYLNSRLSERSEHRTWQRDLRNQYYSALDDEVQNFKLTIAKSPAPTQQEKFEAFYLLYPKISNVTTYGTVSIRDAAFNMFKELSVAAVIDSPRDNADQIDEAITSYREEVRRSLKFDDK
jgi:hypothetical protein